MLWNQNSTVSFRKCFLNTIGLRDVQRGRWLMFDAAPLKKRFCLTARTSEQRKMGLLCCVFSTWHQPRSPISIKDIAVQNVPLSSSYFIWRVFPLRALWLAVTSASTGRSFIRLLSWFTSSVAKVLHQRSLSCTLTADFIGGRRVCRMRPARPSFTVHQWSRSSRKCLRWTVPQAKRDHLKSVQ